MESELTVVEPVWVLASVAIVDMLPRLAEGALLHAKMVSKIVRYFMIIVILGINEL